MKTIKEQIFTLLNKQIRDIDNRQKGMEVSTQTIEVLTKSYGLDEKPIHTFDYYCLKGCDAPERLPLIIDIHGGAFSTGGKEYNRYYGEALVKLGYQVAVPDYELVPQINLKQQIEQIAYAIVNIMHEQPNSGVYLSADSSGSYIVNLLCCIWGREELIEAFDVPVPETAIRAIGLTGAPGTYQIFPAFMIPHRRKMDEMLLSGCEDIKKYLNLREVWNDKVPPIFLMSSEDDMYYNNCRKLEKWLRKNQYPVDNCYSKKKEDGRTFHCFNVLRPDLTSSQKMNAAMHRFFSQI